VIGWRHCLRLVEAANSDIYLLSIRSREEGQWSTTIRQNERKRPAHGSSLGGAVVNLKPLRLNDAHVTKGAPLLRRQSKQWQWVIL
jgi:hypothetical protein